MHPPPVRPLNPILAFEVLHVAYCVLEVPTCKELVTPLPDCALRWAVQ